MNRNSKSPADGPADEQLLLHQLVAGDQRAIEQIYEQSIDKIKKHLSHRLPLGVRRHTDEEDIAQSVLQSFFRGVQKGGRFPKLENHNDLWQIIGMLTKQKLIKHLRAWQAQKRGAGNVRGESVFLDRQDRDDTSGFEGLADLDSSGLAKAMQTEEVDSLLQGLQDESLREIALLKLEGYEHKEIASLQGISVRSVTRKLTIIRDRWQQQIDSSGENS